MIRANKAASKISQQNEVINEEDDTNFEDSAVVDEITEEALQEMEQSNLQLKQTCTDIVATMESLVAGVMTLKEETVASKKNKVNERVYLGRNELLTEKKQEYEQKSVAYKEVKK